MRGFIWRFLADERGSLAAAIEQRKPRVWGYARASTKKQVDSPETQQENMRRYAAFNLADLGEVTFFVDRAMSGKVSWEERPAGAELFQQLQPGDHVILPKLDRGFRRLADCVFVLEKFERMGVKLHIVNMLGGAIDLSSPMGRFLIHILAAFAELERAFISERIRDGMANRKSRGVQHAHFPGYGFKWERRNVGGRWTRVRVRDDEEREVMRSIVSWRTQENPLTWKEISDHLNYELKLKTKDDGIWDENRVRRSFKAALMLEQQERRASS